MMKSFLVVSLLSLTGYAKNLKCEVKEVAEGETKVQTLNVEAQAGNAHGSILAFKGQAYPEVTGFVSLVESNGRTFAVLSMYSELLKTNSSSQHQMVANEQYAELQLSIPNDSLKPSAVEIVCQYFQ